MNSLYLPLADLVAISLLCLAVYYPRHRRRDLLVAFLGVNVGVLAVTTALVNSDATLGLGLGLFGVLSIIRLRSLELGQHEVAYYFAALALGLLGGLGSLEVPLTMLLMAVLVAVIAVADSPRCLPRRGRPGGGAGRERRRRGPQGGRPQGRPGQRHHAGRRPLA